MTAHPRDHSPCPGAGDECFHYRGGELHCEALPVQALAARFETPLYVYSAAAMRRRFQRVRAAFGPEAAICYAVKANSNLAILKLFAGLGAGFDLVSGGELQRLLAAGIDPRTSVFAGAAKQRWEIEAAVAHGLRALQVESPHELAWIAAAGRAAGVRVPVSLRLNPDVDAGTHAYITTGRHDNKFGVELRQAGALVERIAADEALSLCGYHVHLGSQLHSVEPYLQAFARVAEFMDGAAVRRTGIAHYDLGGGFGIGYGKGAPLDVGELAAAMLPALRARGLTPVVEPGRYLVGDAGALVTAVIGNKQAGATEFLLVDAAMNDLLRPALYGAEHPIAPVHDRPPGRRVDVVGPVCESADFLARGRLLPALGPGDLLAILGAGAYGASMAGNYNSRRRPAEVLVDGDSVRPIRRREAFDRLWADEVDA